MRPLLILALMPVAIVLHTIGWKQIAGVDVELASFAEPGDRVELEIGEEPEDPGLTGPNSVVGTVLDARGPTILRVEREGTVIRLSGRLPASKGAREALVATAGEVVGVEQVLSDHLLEGTEVIDSGWILRVCPSLLGPFFFGASWASLEAYDGKLELKRMFYGQRSKDEVWALIRERQGEGGQGWRVVDYTEVGVAQPAELEVRKRGGSVVATGTLPRDAVGEELLRQLGAFSDEVTINLAPNVERRPWMVGVGPEIEAFLGRLSGEGVWAVKGDKLDLKGEVADAAHRASQEAVFLGERWKGMVVRSRMEVGAVLPEEAPLLWQISKQDDQVVTGGAAPPDGWGEEVRERLVAGLGDVRVSLSAGGSMASARRPEWWAAFLPLAVSLCRDADSIDIRMERSALSMKGVMNTAGGEVALLRQLAALPGLPEPVLELRWPEWKAPRLELERGETGVRVQGSVSSPEERTRILEVLREEKSALEASGLTVQSGVEHADWLSEFGEWWPVLIRCVPVASLRVESDRVELGGAARSEGAVQDVRAVLERVFGREYQISVRSLQVGAYPVADLRLTRSGWKILLEGAAPTFLSRADTEAAIRAREPEALIQNRIRVVPELEEPKWLERMNRWWPAMSELVPDVSFHLDSGRLQVAGTALEDDVPDRLRRVMAPFLEKSPLVLTEGLRTPVPGTPCLSVRERGDEVAAVGRCGVASSREALEESLRSHHAAGKVTVRLRAVEGVAEPYWLTSFAQWWPVLKAEVRPVSLVVVNGELEVRGKAVRKESEQVVEDLMTRVMERSVEIGEVMLEAAGVTNP